MPRMPAEQRREEIVGIAIRHFAHGGFHGTSTETIAEEAGVSQPYLFRLFGTKRNLFLACCARHRQRVGETFARAAEGAPVPQRLSRMGNAYVDLIEDRDLLLFHLQMFAACEDPVIREHVRGGYAELVETVMDLTEATPEEVWNFCATGMLINVVASLDLHELANDKAWARTWTSATREVARIDLPASA